ncbi:MAG: toprim domain-containing protein [Bacteroidales bacterium]|nr:toprim domain-containing protein [Bacteroidales bacterium]
MSYFEDRIAEMKLQPGDYSFELKYTEQRFGYEKKEVLPFLKETTDGDIEIFPFDLERKLIEYRKETERKTFTHDGEGLSVYSVIRLSPENIKEGEHKYKMPKGAGTFPFIPPNVIELYEQKKEIKTLYLTEGYLKAIAAATHLKIPIVGLGSITLYKDEKKELYTDIKTIIKECSVENVMMIYDGDTRNISKTPTKNHTDRPYSFFSSALNLRNYIVDENVNFYFCTIKSDQIEGNPKGIDDLIYAKFDEIEKIKINLRKKVTDKLYFTKLDLTGSLSKLKEYLYLHDYKEFWNYHKSIIGYNSFLFFGTEYKYNYENDKLEIVMPEAATRYIRIGDDYFEKIQKPTIHETYNNILSRRMKSTIRDDHGAKVFKFIPKYKDFVLLPSHTDYREIQDGFYNLYAPFIHEPVEGRWKATEKYLEHIFDDQFEIGLDYIQLLYQKPTQILPVLCLVSEQNRTGKSMFAVWLNEIFKGNGIIVGNAEINSEFNAYMIGKLLIAIDEGFIEKKLVVEKIKSYATRTTLPMTKKGKDTIEIDFFAKFLIFSNNVDDFITANSNDIRYWVREIKPVLKPDVNLLAEMKKEIPAFLFFLQKRTLFTKNEDRAWFKPEIIKTDALVKVQERSKPMAQKELELQLTEMFHLYRIKELNFCLKDIQDIVFNKKYSSVYIKEILTKNLGVKPAQKTGKYKYPIAIDDYDELIIKKGNSTFYTFTPEMFNIDSSDFKSLDENTLPF